ncbi:Signal recognition particle 14 kDa [Hyphodiscus hymeniophilus]|uniref:Signal recognition particle subunit SRP14 n=1 Tax=Hyphodiscus hymeniophilus TaxID=353542 RepID=A0A9P7AVF0_9HELO|nr:Signal recognition particle 14 kDa [Hyphodiscus hymeniophilus]
MSKGHLSNDEFFVRLSSLFDERRQKDHGSVYLTQKRLSYDKDTDVESSEQQFPDLHPTAPLPILIRATNGKSKDNKAKKVKLSTVVESDAIEGFFAKYAEVCKGGMSGLKKRDRSKAKEKLKAKKRKQAAGGDEVKK